MSRVRIHVRRRGFTVIELITVVCVLGILALAVGSPTLSYMASIRARSAAARLLSDIRYMQRYAMSSRARTWITLNVASNRYQLYVEDPANPGKAGRKAAMQPLDQSTGATQFGSGPFSGVSISAANI